MLAAKLRRAMRAPGRHPLAGLVEVDESSLPLRTKSIRRPAARGAAMTARCWIAGAIEVNDGKPGRLRLAALDDYTAASLHAFIKRAIAPGSTAKTDGLSSTPRLAFERSAMTRMSSAPWAAHIILPWIRPPFPTLKTWGKGVYHGLRRHHRTLTSMNSSSAFNRCRSRQARLNFQPSLASPPPHQTRSLQNVDRTGGRCIRSSLNDLGATICRFCARTADEKHELGKIQRVRCSDRGGFLNKLGPMASRRTSGKLLARVQKNPCDLLRNETNFEVALVKARKEMVKLKPGDLALLESAVQRTFEDMDKIAKQPCGQPCKEGVEKLLDDFMYGVDTGYIFTLNQDLLIERQFSKHPSRNWLHDPGVEVERFSYSHERPDLRVKLHENFKPSQGNKELSGHFNYVKLHGSQNFWHEKEHIMIVGKPIYKFIGWQ